MPNSEEVVWGGERGIFSGECGVTRPAAGDIGRCWLEGSVAHRRILRKGRGSIGYEELGAAERATWYVVGWRKCCMP